MRMRRRRQLRDARALRCACMVHPRHARSAPGRDVVEARDGRLPGVETIQLALNGEFVELCQLLKLAGIAGSGGEGKHIVAAGEVTVDGRPESRKKAKIRAGQKVECRGITVIVAGSARG
jgi:ribosome-associated protein